MKKQDDKQKPKAAKRVQAVLALLLGLVPLFTLAFGTKESPFFYTLSGIGNALGYRISFIIWGVVTGLTIAVYTLYLFKKAGYSYWPARIVLFSALACLVLTVLTPVVWDMLPLEYVLHVMFSSLFALLVIAALLLFIRHIAQRDSALAKTALYWLISCIGFSLLTLLLTGLNAMAEILFFIGIAVFLFVLNLLLKPVRNIRGQNEAGE